jgi:hypothetical protein
LGLLLINTVKRWWHFWKTKDQEKTSGIPQLLLQPQTGWEFTRRGSALKLTNAGGVRGLLSALGPEHHVRER